MLSRFDTIEPYRIAIVGAGPAGLSAAVRAARLGVSHVLIEASAGIANTVRRFTRGKLVMAEPSKLPLRSDLRFAAGAREFVLDVWEEDVASAKVNLLANAEVKSIGDGDGCFRIELASGEAILAENVVLAIGLQGNLRKLDIPGSDLSGIEYQLDDPAEYSDQTVVVIGGGDAGIENALALSDRNSVLLLNWQEEFTNCREENSQRLREAVSAGRIETRLGSSAIRIESSPVGDFPLTLFARTPQGEEILRCHRIIARIGATPPREFLAAIGIEFGSSDPTAVPRLSQRYESSVPGLYVIGALAGYSLIKQALNQGHEIVDFILGHPVEPADQELLLEKFSRIPHLPSVNDGIEMLRRGLPLFGALTSLQLREFMLESDIHVLPAGQVFFERNDYSNSFYSLLQGSVEIHLLDDEQGTSKFRLKAGEFFGELGLLSGRRRSATVIAGEGCVVLETPRRSMLKLLDISPSVRKRLDEVSLKRIIGNCYGLSPADPQIDDLVKDAYPKTFDVGDILFHEGDAADALYLIRRGSVTVSRSVGGKEVVFAYLAAGNYVGEMALVSNMPRTATVRAAALTEVVILDAGRFITMLEQSPDVRSRVSGRYLERLRVNESSGVGGSGDLMRFLMGQGAGEATDILLIDYTRCIHCDNCERACAELHDGNSRLDRKAGQTFENLHVPASCRHCEHPKCMIDCPPDAIHRSAHGEVFFGDSCIGCGNCQANCPYGVIQMATHQGMSQPSLWRLVLGLAPKTRQLDKPATAEHQRAVKCDMCRGVVGGAACVRACPTGAAFRIHPEELVQATRKPHATATD
jgi:CRP-like cAMP-binding protein/thioredoxin reductase/Fe-S-cluster-containing hydrogenase component 2